MTSSMGSINTEFPLQFSPVLLILVTQLPKAKDLLTVSSLQLG
jgi:hypothetical protein